MAGDDRRNGGLSGEDIKWVVYGLTGIVAGIIVLDFLGLLLIPGYQRTESAIFGVIVGGITGIIVGRVWLFPRNGGK